MRGHKDSNRVPALLVLDLDGTTCDDQGNISRENRRALQWVRSQGNMVCFATGRREVDMLPLGDVSDCADYLLLNNGGKLVETGSGRVLFRERIDPVSARQLVEFCLHHDYLLHVLAGTLWAVNKENDSLREYADQLGVWPSRFQHCDQLPLDDIEGFTVTQDWKPVWEFVRRKGLALSVTPSDPTSVDIMAPGISKWNGICRLLSLLPVQPFRIIAVGDYDNDIEMIKNSDIGVAVANARPHVKGAADYVSPFCNNEDTVAHIVAHFFEEIQ